MDVKYLNYILAIANRHNMTKAAEDLFVSQSSLSQYLSRLEQELGTNRGVPSSCSCAPKMNCL